MIGSEHHIFGLPSTRSLLDRLADQLAGGTSLLVLLPPEVDPADVQEQISARLGQRDVWETSLDTRTPGVMTPATALANELGIDWPSPDTPRTISNLVAELACQPRAFDVVHIDHVTELSDAMLQDWLDALRQWSEASRFFADEGVPTCTLCLCVRAPAVRNRRLPDSDVRLQVIRWQGLPSVLELHVACRLLLNGDAATPAGRWREHLLPPLAGSDTMIITALWEHICRTPADLRAALHSLADERGWERDHIESLTSPFLDNHFQPNGKLRSRHRWQDLWDAGLAVCTPEYGWELHPAALALLGRVDELDHRIWRGQSALVLPMVEQIRLTLCDEISRTHGTTWPCWGTPDGQRQQDAVAENPRACEWGYLVHLLETHSHRFGAGRNRWHRLARIARNVRNEIAHYRPITFAEFEVLCNEFQSVLPRARDPLLATVS